VKESRVNWAACRAVVNQEFPRIATALGQFRLEHPEWEYYLYQSDGPPEVRLQFYLKVPPNSRRATVLMPHRIERCTHEELDIIANFVASIALGLVARYYNSKDGMHEYTLRPKYRDFLTG